MDYLKDYFEAYKHTSEWKDRGMVSIYADRAKYEAHLDEMWRIAKSGNLQQLPIYKEQVRYLKDHGITTLRNKDGKHKLVLKK